MNRFSYLEKRKRIKISNVVIHDSFTSIGPFLSSFLKLLDYIEAKLLPVLRLLAPNMDEQAIVPWHHAQ